MMMDEFDEVIGFLSGVLLRELSPTQRDAWWMVLQYYDYGSTMKRSREFVDSEQARYGFPKPHDVVGFKVATAERGRDIGIRCDQCGDSLALKVATEYGEGGRVTVRQDISEIQRHYSAHAMMWMEKKHGPDASKWPDHTAEMRKMLRAADAAARAETAKRERSRVEDFHPIGRTGEILKYRPRPTSLPRETAGEPPVPAATPPDPFSGDLEF